MMRRLWRPSFSGPTAANVLRKGIFPINKKKDISSAAVLNQLKEILTGGSDPRNELRMGHGGTLDLTANGVLVVGTNWGCKELPILLNGVKEYLVVGQLGLGTDTYNETGKVVDIQPYDHVNKVDMEEVLMRFVGDIWQKAPLYSALKVDGKRMSDWTLEGHVMEQKERRVSCLSLQLTEFDPPFYTLHVRSGGGFYVRSLINDIGKALKTCSHVRSLQRLAVGPFTLNDALNEEEWTLDSILESIVRCRPKFKKYAASQQRTKRERERETTRVSPPA